jgi:hypothetical protein
MTVVGASLGGVLAAAVSPYTCFLVAAVGLLAAAVLAYGIRQPAQLNYDGGADPRVLFALHEALRFLKFHPRVRALVTVKSAVGLGNGVLATYPALALLLHDGNLGTGLLFAARGAGALIGPMVIRMAVMRRPALLFTFLASSMFTYGASYLVIAALPWISLALLMVVVAHAAGGGNWATSSAALQAAVPDRLRGRVMAADLMLTTLVISGAQVAVGLFVDHVALRILIAACGAATLSYSLVWRMATRHLMADTSVSYVEK